MASDDVVERIRELFAEVLNVDPPLAETDLIESDQLDSLALVELLFEIEREFGVTLGLDEVEIDDFRTVARIGQLVGRSGGKGAQERALP